MYDYINAASKCISIRAKTYKNNLNLQSIVFYQFSRN